MLTKLLKYECRASIRIFGVVYLAILGLCVGSGILNLINDRNTSDVLDVPISHMGTVVWVITALFLVASVIITTVINLRRFYVGVFRDEGYLMHTLPVETWEILASKLLAALMWTVATSLVMLLSVSLAFMIGYGDGFLEILKGIWEAVADLFSDPLLLLLGLLELVAIILRVYAAIALGQIFSHRVMAAVLVWFGLNSLQTWSSLLLGASVFEQLTNSLFLILPNNSSTPAYGLLTGMALLWSAVYWAVTQWVMMKKLNLE